MQTRSQLQPSQQALVQLPTIPRVLQLRPHIISVPLLAGRQDTHDLSERWKKAPLLGRFQVEGLLEKGGFAKVYLARDIESRCQVAVKVHNPSSTHLLFPDYYLKRFHHEIAFVQQLQGLKVPVYLGKQDSGQDQFFVMAAIPSLALCDLSPSLYLALADGASRQLIRRIALELCLVMDNIHSSGVIHLDVKPGNVLISNLDPVEGNLFMIDFGFSCSSSGIPEYLADMPYALALGTPQYQSPEICSGKGVFGFQTDVYSTAVVIYEMIIGFHPYPHCDIPRDLLIAHQIDPFPMASRVNPLVHEEISEVLCKAASKNPQDRYSTMREFGEAMRAAQFWVDP